MKQFLLESFFRPTIIYISYYQRCVRRILIRMRTSNVCKDFILLKKRFRLLL